MQLSDDFVKFCSTRWRFGLTLAAPQRGLLSDMQAQSQSQTVQLRCYFPCFHVQFVHIATLFLHVTSSALNGSCFLLTSCAQNRLASWRASIHHSLFMCDAANRSRFHMVSRRGARKKKSRNTSGFLGRSFVVFPFALAAAHFGDRALSLTIFLVLYAERRIVHIVLHKNLPTPGRGCMTKALMWQSRIIEIRIHKHVKSFWNRHRSQSVLGLASAGATECWRRRCGVVKFLRAQGPSTSGFYAKATIRFHAMLFLRIARPCAVVARPGWRETMVV